MRPEQSGRRRLLAIMIILIVAASAGAAVYLKRQDIRDRYQRWRQGPIPTALTAEEARNLAAGPAAEKAEPSVLTDEPVLLPDDDGPPAAPPDADEPVPPQPTPQTEEPSAPPDADEPVPPAAPAEINLKVPMIYQSPFAVWDRVDDDACEEASLLMVHAYLNGESSISREEMRRRIDDVVAYEMSTLGFFEDTDAEQTVEIMKNHLGLTETGIFPVESIDDLKRQIAVGRPVLLPVSGKELKNPNFRNGGPDYHMLVAKGYKPGWIITNDPGTRKGADYLYEEGLLFGAIHDWNGGAVLDGEKVMIVVE